MIAAANSDDSVGSPAGPGHRDPAARGAVAVQKAYGKNHAITVEATKTRAGEPTLSFEFAAALEGQENPSGFGRKYNWQEKFTVQLKVEHLSLYAAALLGDIPSLRLDHYGDPPTKTFICDIHDAGVVALRGLTKGSGHMVPIVAGRLYWFITQALGRLCDASGGSLDMITARALVKRDAQMYVLKQSVDEKRRGHREKKEFGNG